MEGQPTVRWQPGGFLDNFNTAALHLGYDHLPLAYGLARVNWKDTQTRDSVLRALTRITEGDTNGG